MTIIRTRIAFENHFVQIPNAWMRDQRLSRRARGLLAEIMTHEVGWKLSTQILTDNGPEGRDAIRGALTELEKHGYLARVQGRTGGKFDAVDFVLQDPFRTMEIPAVPAISPSPENPAPVKPSPVDPQLRTPELLKEEHQEENKGGSPMSGTSPARAEDSAPADSWSDLGGLTPPDRPQLSDPERCQFHQHAISPGPCRACRTAREAHEEAQRQAYRQSVLAERERQRTAHEARLAAIADCQLCDDEGYAHGVPCYHDPDQADRARRGAAMVRQTLAELE